MYQPDIMGGLFSLVELFPQNVHHQSKGILWFTCIFLRMLYLIHCSDTKRQERSARKAKQTEDTNAILCNSVKMIREKLTVSDGK